MGRPRVSDEKRIPTAVRLPESLHRRLHSAAGERAVSANMLVTRAVSDYLERLPSVETTLTTGGPTPSTALSRSRADGVERSKMKSTESMTDNASTRGSQPAKTSDTGSRP